MTEGTKNLTVARGSRSVWDKPGLAATLSALDRDRWIAAAVGSTLALVGARRKDVGGGLMALVFHSARKGYDDRIQIDTPDPD